MKRKQVPLGVDFLTAAGYPQPPPFYIEVPKKLPRTRKLAYVEGVRVGMWHVMIMSHFAESFNRRVQRKYNPHNRRHFLV